MRGTPFLSILSFHYHRIRGGVWVVEGGTSAARSKRETNEGQLKDMFETLERSKGVNHPLSSLTFIKT